MCHKPTHFMMRIWEHHDDNLDDGSFQVSSNTSLLKLPKWVELSTWGNFFTLSCIILCWNCNFKICICPWLSIRGPGQMLCKQRTKVWLEGGEGSVTVRGFELVTFWEWGSCGGREVAGNDWWSLLMLTVLMPSNVFVQKDRCKPGEGMLSQHCWLSSWLGSWQCQLPSLVKFPTSHAGAVALRPGRVFNMWLNDTLSFGQQDIGF